MQLDKVLKEKVLKNFDIPALNEMQERVIEACSKSGEVVLVSPTGSGKTLGFVLPIISKLDSKKSGVQALVLAPSRELALQIETVIKKTGSGYKVNCCYGGHPMRIEKNNLEHPPAILVGTPGRIADHLRRGNFNPSTIRNLVLDEFDKALEFGFEKEMTFILNQLKDVRQKVLTSATNGLEIPDFVKIKDPIRLGFNLEDEPKGLDVKVVRAEGKDKLEVLFRLICDLGNESTLVFCNHREAVERISELLHDKGLQHDTFHGGMKQEERERALIKFRNGSHHLLITTDLASRGLDIPEIKYVIHYQKATSPDVYVHRNGRTARMNAQGTGLLVLAQEEACPEWLEHEPELLVPCEVPVLPELPQWITLYFGLGRKDKINKIDLVGLLLKVGKLQKDELGLIEVLDHAAYVAVSRKKVEKVLQLIKRQKIKRKQVKVEVSY